MRGYASVRETQVTDSRALHCFLVVLCSLLLFCLTEASAQMPPFKPRHFNLGIGATLPKFFDESFSALRYQGYAASVTTGLVWARPDTAARHVAHVRFDYGQMSAFSIAYADLNAFRFEGHYAYERQAAPLWRDRIRWYVGGNVSGLWTLWQFQNYSNNSFNNSFYFSLSPQTTLEYPFRLWKRNFQVSYTAFLPLLTFAIRPAYGTTRLPEFLDDERDEPVRQFVGSGRLVSFNHYFRYSNTIALEYALRNTNRLRISYTWDFVGYDAPRLVQSASHNITIATMFNF